MLDLREHSSRHIRKAIARYATARRPKTRKVVLARVGVAPASAAFLEGEEVGLDCHLEEGVVPADPPCLAVLSVVLGYALKARVDRGIAALEEGHEALRRHACR